MKKSNNTALSRSGFSLVELMVVAAISGIIMLGIMSIVSYQQKANKTTSLNAQVDDIRRQIQVWIGTQNSCNFTFKGMSNGDSLIGFKSKNDGVDSDYILKTGDRFPGTNWTVKTVSLLSSTEVTAQFPQFSPQVSTDGTAMGVLKVEIAQLTGSNLSNSNTLETDISKTKAYAALNKILYFPIQAVFGTPVILMALQCDKLDINKTPADGGLCCADCVIPKAGKTYQAYVQGLTIATAGTAANPIYFQSDYSLNQNSPPNYGCTPFVPPPPGLTTYIGTCYAYNYNLPILTCNAATQNPIKN